MEAIKQNKSFVPRTFPPRVPAYALHPAPASFRFTCHWTLLTLFLSTNVLASSPTILRPFLRLHGGVALSYLFKKQLRACGRGHHSHCTGGHKDPPVSRILLFSFGPHEASSTGANIRPRHRL
jgi:hypothetical protein